MQHTPTAQTARISEIFSSLQGEGTHLGERHLFIRFEECHIHCTYCDELDKPGKNYSIEEALRVVDDIEREQGPHSFVSLTGGEPLLYIAYLKPLIAKLKEKNFKIYLETNGILWKALQEIICDCDVIAMDLKPASVTGEKPFDEEHEIFFKTALQTEVFIKIIISKALDPEEYDRLIQIVDRVAPKTPVVLVPLSNDIEGHEDPELMTLLLKLQRRASEKLHSVRIVPRLHKILNIR